MSTEKNGRHSHHHSSVDPALLTTEKGLWAVKWSFAGLIVTALFQVAVVYFSASVALLADTIHNFGDAVTAIPLWIAFVLVRRPPSVRFTYGLGRLEDLAGSLIVFTILASAVIAGYESISRFMEPKAVRYPVIVIAAGLIGFVGNELVALFRIKIGREINSAALVADGRHARVDGLTSLGVVLSAVGVKMGYPLADPIIALLITLAILRIAWESGRQVFTRLLDGVDPELVDEIRAAVRSTPGIKDITDVRVRWLGHRLHAEINLTVDGGISVSDAHRIAQRARNTLQTQNPVVWKAVFHVDPPGVSGEEEHRAEENDL
jgi:cation diffusion facilitator family transporter